MGRFQTSEATSFDAFLQEMDKMPIFMNALPEDHTENVELQALQALLHDGTPDENAENFKRQGNEAFQQNTKEGLQNAAHFYTKGLEQNPDDRNLTGVLLVNRALVHLKRQNLGWAVKDCLAALALVNDRSAPSSLSSSASTSSSSSSSAAPSTAADTSQDRAASEIFVLKAFLRLADAFRQLERYTEAKRVLENGLKWEPENHYLSRELERIEALVEQSNLKAAQRLQKEAESKKRTSRVLTNLHSRGAQVLSSDAKVASSPFFEYPSHPSVESSEPMVYEDESISVPTVFLYPPYGQADYITGFHERTTLAEQLQDIFAGPAPWDEEKIYRHGDMDIFYEAIQMEQDTNATPRLQLATVDPSMTLGGLLSRPDFVIRDHKVILVILPKTGVERKRFLADYKTYLKSTTTI